MESIVKESMAKIVGANPSEVVMMNTLTANIHFMMAAFYRPTQARHKILIEKRAFPSDIQATVSQIMHHGFDPATSLLEVAPRAGEELLRIEDIEEVIQREGNQIALIHLSGLQYYTGQVFDIPRITAAGHAQGCMVGFDLAHSAGNVLLRLHEWNVDFATWCSYKYLNCGPGSIGGCFVHSKHTEPVAVYPHPGLPGGAASELVKTSAAANGSKEATPSGAVSGTSGPVLRLTGWWGHRLSDRFLMSGDFIADGGANGFQVSNPSVLLIACVRASMDLFDRVSMHPLEVAHSV